MIRLLRFLLVVITLLSHSRGMTQVATDPAAAANSPSLNHLKLEFDIDRAELAAPLTELDKLYLDQLSKLGQQSQARGALEELIAVRGEQARMEGRQPEAKASDFAELVKIRAIYEKSRADRIHLQRQRLLPVIARYKAELETLRTAQTKKSLLEEAVRTNEELIKLTGLEAEIRTAPENPTDLVMRPAFTGAEGAAQARSLKVKVQVDGISHLVLRDGQVWFDHSKGRSARPGQHEGQFPTLLNDKIEWMPLWKGPTTEPFTVAFQLPQEEGVKIKLRMSSGRGIAEVIQQPSAENIHTAIIELRDQDKGGGMFFGSDWLEFRLSW